MAVELRRIGAGEWRELRDLRLRALTDAPDAFTATYGGESTLPDTHRTDWATELAEGGPSFGLVARDLVEESRRGPAPRVPRPSAPGHHLERGGGSDLRAVRVRRCGSSPAAPRRIRHHHDVHND